MLSRSVYMCPNCLIFLSFHPILSPEPVSFRIPKTAAKFTHAAQTQTAVLLGFAVFPRFLNGRFHSEMVN